MQDNIIKSQWRMINTIKRSKRWRKVLTVLSCFVVFVTVYLLILPAITVSNEPICGIENHKHTPECFEDGSVAYDEMFLEKLPSPSDNWSKSFLEIAHSQIGYEQKSNGDDEETYRHYTMYGSAFDSTKEHWDASFVSWCLMKANIPSEEKADSPFIPLNNDTGAWIEKLGEESILHVGTLKWTPQPGDIVFFNDNEGRQRAGIIEKCNSSKDESKVSSFNIISGDWDGIVDSRELSFKELNVIGWVRIPNNPDNPDIVVIDKNDYTSSLMRWTDGVGAIVKGGDVKKSSSKAKSMMAPGIAPMSLDDDVSPLPLGNTKDYGEGAGYITERTIFWRDPDSVDGTWNRYAVGSTSQIPANAEFRMLVKFIGVNKNLLKEHGYVLEYTAESILTDFVSSGVIRNEDGTIVGEISARSSDDNNEVFLDFSTGSDWIDSLNTVLESEFYYQGHLDLKKLEDAEAGIITLAGINIQIPDSSDAIAQFASVELEKQSSGLYQGADGHYYIDYTLDVIAGEYGCTDLKLIDTLTAQGNASYVNGYIGVTGEKTLADGPIEIKPLDSGSEKGNAGKVYLTNTTVQQIIDKQTNLPVENANGKKLAWEIGNLEPNEHRTLQYRVSVNDKYIGIAHQNEAITNSATLMSKNYERGTKIKNVNPTATAAIYKRRVGEARIENGKYVIDYEVEVIADRNNDYPLTDVKVYDHANQYEGREYASDVKLVEGSVRLFDSNNNELNLADYTTYTAANGTQGTRNNPRRTGNNTFDIFVGDLAPGESKKLTYTLELDVSVAQEKGNGALGIFNRSYVYSDENRQNRELNASGTRDIQSYNEWVAKTAGAQAPATTNYTIPAGAKVYDATRPIDSSTGLLPTISGVTGYTIPAGAYSYTVKINQSGDWDVTSATWKDSIQASDSAGNKYLRFTKYARIDVYDKLKDSATGQNVSNPPIKETIWVKIDGQTQFAFTGKQIGLDGSDSYVITYYAEAILPAGVTSYGTINADNQFNMYGTVGNGSIFINPNIMSRVTVTAKEPGVNDPVKVAWYYDAQDTTFDKYHENNEGNGSLYWIIKISGDKIPRNMKFQESIRVGAWNNYLRNDESLLGFYLVSFPEGTDTASNANEFLDRYKTFEDFQEDMYSEESNITVVPKIFNDSSLYTDVWSGYTDKRYGDNGKHYDLTITFDQDYAIPPSQALYLLIKTDPVQMPGNGQTIVYNNKCNFRTDAMGNIGNWPNTQTTQKIYGPEGSLQKGVSQITDTYVASNGNTYSKGSGVYRVSNNGRYFEYYDLSTKKFEDYSKTTDYKRGNSSNGSTRTFQVNSNYLKKVTDSGARTNYTYEDGTYLVWKVTINRNGSMGGYTGYWIEDEIPEGLDLAYVRTSYVNVNAAYPSGTGDWARSGSNAGPENIIANENAEWVSEGWQRHRMQHSLIGSQGNYNWARYGTVYYTKDNVVRMYVPSVIGTNNSGNDRVEFQIVCRLNDEGEANLVFGDSSYNNQATLYDQYKKKVESSGAEILVTGGNVNKQLLMDGKFNESDSSKLNSTVFPYRIEVNTERVDMVADSDIISLPLHDRMTGNMTMQLDTLRIYALPEGKNKEDTTGAGDADLIYYGGNYSSNPKFQGHFWYTEDKEKVGTPVGYCGDSDTPINVFVIPSVDEETKEPILGPDGSQMQEVVFENLPDGVHLVITYSVSVKLKDGNRLIFDNKAFWEKHEENVGGETDTVIREYLAEGNATSSEHGAVHIVKYDADSYSKRLAGAEFEIYRAEYKLATAGNVYIEGRDTPLNQNEIDARHSIAVYVGYDYTYSSKDKEIPCLRNSDGELLAVYLEDSTGNKKWMNISEAYSYGYNLHHKFDTNEDGSLKLCVLGPLAQGETDANGNLSYGFGDGKDFGRRFEYVNGEKVYLDPVHYEDDRIHFNKVYAVKESKAPYGYEIDNTPYFFVVPNEKYDGYGLNYFYHEIWPDEVHICTLSENGEITFMHNAANIKQRLTVSKDFAGSINAYKPGSYTFGIWNTTNATKSNMITSATITYTENDFGWYDDGNGNQIYGLLPNHKKTIQFPSTLDLGTYYIYELNTAGNPIITSGNINGYTYTPEFSGPSVGTTSNQIIFDSKHKHVDVINRGYSIDVEKNFLDLGGNVLENGLRGTYSFGIWKESAIGDDGLPRSNEKPIDIQTIVWDRGDLQSSKKATFTGLSREIKYYIFELDAQNKPIPDRVQATLNDGSFVVYYSTNEGIKPADNMDYVLTVSNSAFITLPRTGGIGTNSVIYSGIALMSIACLGYIYCLLRRKKKYSF